MAEIKEGDVVVLKSNPEVTMTVDFINEESGTATCVWLDSDSRKQAEAFSLKALKPVDVE